MQFTKTEIEALQGRKKTRNADGKPVSLMQQIREYPGRIVKVKTAHARMMRAGKGINEACTAPANIKKNPKGMPFRNKPEFNRDLASDEPARVIAQKWGVTKDSIVKYRRRLADEKA